MIAIITVVIILILSILITKIATIALTHTGLSRETARFQARSAFTGVGFTTSESEKVVNSPVRRKILLLLMILGNAGIVTSMSSLIIGFVKTGTDNLWLKIIILLTSIIFVWHLSNSKYLERWLSNIISRLLKKYTALDVNDYSSLLHLSGDYRISELGIEEDHWLCQKQLKNTGLREEGIIILAVVRKDATFIGAPQRETIIKPGDLLVIYGRAPAMENLEKRHKGVKGSVQHVKQMVEQEEVVKNEVEQDKSEVASKK